MWCWMLIPSGLMALVDLANRFASSVSASVNDVVPNNVS